MTGHTNIWIQLSPWKSTQWFIVSRLSPGRYTIVCFCASKRDAQHHCPHTRRLWPLVKPWFKARLKPITPEA